MHKNFKINLDVNLSFAFDNSIGEQYHVNYDANIVPLIFKSTNEFDSKLIIKINLIFTISMTFSSKYSLYTEYNIILIFTFP